MADLVPTVAELPTLATCINERHRLVVEALQSGLEDARNAGAMLLQAKAAVPHGGWLPWLKANCEFSERSAQSYMQIANRWDELTAKAQRIADLSYRDGLKLLADEGETNTPTYERFHDTITRDPLGKGYSLRCERCGLYLGRAGFEGQAGAATYSHLTAAQVVSHPKISPHTKTAVLEHELKLCPPRKTP